jgi:hypothetical protein
MVTVNRVGAPEREQDATTDSRTVHETLKTAADPSDVERVRIGLGLGTSGEGLVASGQWQATAAVLRVSG